MADLWNTKKAPVGSGEHHVVGTDAAILQRGSAMALLVAGEMNLAVENATGLGAVAASALVTISHALGESIDNVTQVLRRSHSAVVRLVGTLVDQELVRRGAGADSRVVRLDLTAKGKRMVRAALAERALVLRHLFGVLSESEQRSLDVLANRIIGAEVEDEVHAPWICRLCDGESCVPCPMEEKFPD